MVDYYEMLNILNIIIVPFTLMYFCLFVVMLGRKYLRLNSHNKVLRFTQEELKGVRSDIDRFNMCIQRQRNASQDDADSLHYEIVHILSVYNELAIGIQEGLYDESYIRMTIGFDMIDFYKTYYKYFMDEIKINEERYMYLGLLLKRWDTNGNSPYRLQRRGKI